MRIFSFLVSALFLLMIIGCAKQDLPVKKSEKKGFSPPPVKHFSKAPNTSQIPQEKLKEVFGHPPGYNKTDTSTNFALFPKDKVAMENSQASAPGSKVLAVLGPIIAEGLDFEGTKSSDAGQIIREAIAQELTSKNRMVLIDAPQERFRNDSPRPDLVNKGIAYVIKGVVSCNRANDHITVFLRAVCTSNGKIKAVASSRNRDREDAAAQAARILLQRLEGE